MPKNESGRDRALRVVIGLLIITFVAIGPKTPWAWLGLVPIITGLVGFCPLYALLGVSTCPVEGKGS